MTLTAEEATTTVQKLHDELEKRRKEINRLDNYYRGKHPLEYASDHWRAFHADRYKDFSDNWCSPVANAPSERLRLQYFRLPFGPRGSKSLATRKNEDRLWSAWDTNDMDVQSSQGFLDALVGKRSFVLVWADENEQPEDTWEDATQMIVGYDPERPRVRKAALKVWADERTEFATLYTSDQVWKFQRAIHAVNVVNGQTSSGLYVGSIDTRMQQGTWQPRTPASDDSWPLPNPLGVVPVVEYQNRPMLRAEPVSEIEGVAPMQDAINLLWAYLFAAADYASMPSRVVMGADLPQMPVLADDGTIAGWKPIPLDKIEQDRLLWLTKPDTTIGEFTASKLDVFTGVIEISVGHIASQTRTPPHYLAIDGKLINIGGDALKAAETGLVKKVQEQQLFFSPSNREVMRLNALVLDDKKLADAAARGTSDWADCEIRSDAQLADTLVKLKTIGWPLRMLAERYGLAPAEVDRLMELKAEEAALDPFAAMAGMTGDQPPAEQ